MRSDAAHDGPRIWVALLVAAAHAGGLFGIIEPTERAVP